MATFLLLATIASVTFDARASAIAHLRQHRHPQLDAAAALEQHVDMALAARASSAWASAVPWDVFCDAVLPPACLDEPRDDWRRALNPRCATLVAGAESTAEAALLLNGGIWAEFGVRFEPNLSPRFLAPLTVMESGRASCTGLSLLLTACCRSVGVPARVAGVGAWADGSGNHVWVEVWARDGWHSLGACEPTELDQTWFAERLLGIEAPRVFASSYRWDATATADTSFPVPWPTTLVVPAVEVTSRYRGEAARERS